MSDLNALENEGVLALNMPDTPQIEKTVVVLGVARSGTSMVAKVLESLGVYMGEKLGPVFEDVALSQAIEKRDTDSLNNILAQRDSQHAIWGWKRPSALKHYEVWRNRFRNPYLIAIFRDPFAIANRNRISMMSDLFGNMEQSTRQLADLIGFLGRQNFPLLLCSYEKALGSPERFVHAVDGFLSLDAPERREYAAGQIIAGPRKYLQSSRITISKGRLGMINRQICRGWAYYTKLPKKAAKVQIFVNGVLEHVVDANMPRPELKKKGVHPTGLCGFSLDWPEDSAPEAGDLVDVRVEGDIESLDGSPVRISGSSDI